MRDIHGSISIVEEILKEISENNDIEIDQTGQLRILLFNLKIQGAYTPAIKPIAKALSEVIDSLHDSTYNLVNHKRDILRQEWNNIKEYIEGNEENKT